MIHAELDKEWKLKALRFIEDERMISESAEKLRKLMSEIKRKRRTEEV